VPARDRRSVGELLADADLLARETLLDASADQALAMVRTWSRVVVSAAGLCALGRDREHPLDAVGVLGVVQGEVAEQRVDCSQTIVPGRRAVAPGAF
jgi:hypothetical protein